MDHKCFMMLNQKLGIATTETIYRPFSFSQSTGKLSDDDWGIRVEYIEVRGKRKSKKHITLFISYCPICGKPLNSDIAAPEESEK